MHASTHSSFVRAVCVDAHVRICAGCALKAHGVLFPEMETAAKPSSQPRTKPCVATGNGHCEASEPASGKGFAEFYVCRDDTSGVHSFASDFKPAWGGRFDMATQPIPQPHKQEVGSPYCSDPNCPYCKELRKASEQVRNNQDSRQK